MDDNEKTPKNARKFYCNFCHFGCCKQSDWNRHITRPKHLKCLNGNKNGSNDKNFDKKNAACKYVCDCGSVYKYQSGLVRHKKTQSCENVKEITNHTNVNADVSSVKYLTDLVLEVVKQNKELVSELVSLNSEAQKQNQQLTNKIVEICNNTTNNVQINNSTNHSNNKTFNLNVFLNETCKDAMNITDFVDSLQLQLSDLEDVGKLGFVDGISNIIVKNLKALDVHKRPVHCADKKREVIYIKDDNKWEKENEDKNKLRKAIKRVAFKNEKLLPKFKELHPGCSYSESKYSDHYSKLVIEAVGGVGNNAIEQQDKIIKNIAKAIVIDKTNN
jgi:predicted RNase H-like nuclease (RuvC/YqgF family)